MSQTSPRRKKTHPHLKIKLQVEVFIPAFEAGSTLDVLLPPFHRNETAAPSWWSVTHIHTIVKPIANEQDTVV